MYERAILLCGLYGALSVSCSGTSGSPGPGSTGGPGGPGRPAANSLTGTWNLITTAGQGATGIPTTVTIGQDSLTITSPEFSVTATRTGNALAFADDESPGAHGAKDVLTATQTAGTFNAGILPFNLGGSWTMQGGPNGGAPVYTCTLNVSATEIDGACQQISPAKPWFSFTSQKMSSEASSLGDFGGKWLNTWGGTSPCMLEFAGNGISTCTGGAVNGSVSGNPLAGITFTYDGANTISGAAQGWAEFSATR